MTRAIVGPLGQITLPLEIVDVLGLREGDEVEFVELSIGQYALKPSARSVVELRGMFGHPARQVTIEDMTRAIEGKGKSAR